MSSSLSRRVFQNVGEARSLEEKDFQLLRSLLNVTDPHPEYRLPLNGELARMEHVSAPLDHMHTLSSGIQNSFNLLTANADVLSSAIQQSNNNLYEQLQYLDNEIHYWYLQHQVNDDNVTDFVHDFESGFTLEIQNQDNVLTSTQNIQAVDYSRNSTEDDTLLVKDQLFSGQQSIYGLEDRLAMGIPMVIQGVQRSNEESQVKDYLKSILPSSVAIVNGSNPILWSQNAVNPVSIAMDGYLDIRLQSPQRMSYLYLDITPMEALTHISLYDSYGKETILGAANHIHFVPQQVASIRIHIDGRVLQKDRLAYQLYAHHLSVVDNSDSDGRGEYVYFTDNDAKQLGIEQ